MPASTFQLLLKSNDAAITRADFEGTAFPCAICFENRKGKQSVQLPKCGCILWVLGVSRHLHQLLFLPELVLEFGDPGGHA